MQPGVSSRIVRWRWQPGVDRSSAVVMGAVSWAGGCFKLYLAPPWVSHTLMRE